LAFAAFFRDRYYIFMTAFYSDMKLAGPSGSIATAPHRPMAPELVRRTRELLPKVKLLRCYGLSETGFLTGLEDQEHVDAKLLSCGRPCPGIDMYVEDEAGKEVEIG
jgi:acyl-coenzyme A synthetase/AMP-(fatty) acid ligase